MGDQQHPELDEAGQALPGWPRPRLAFQEDPSTPPQVLPVPWALEMDEAGEPIWLSIRPDIERAHYGRLCQVCGERLGRAIVLGCDALYPAHHPYTSGPGCHPRCMALAATFCPHFVAAQEHPDVTIAMLYQGEGLGYAPLAPDEDSRALFSLARPIAREATPMTLADVKALARDNPLGV